jgi:Sulfotransferase domain
MESVHKKIYHLIQPSRVRNPDHPMQVLALGLPRTGTESLRQALSILDYNHVYHGFDIVLSPPDCKSWSQLFTRKQKSTTKLTAEDFDRILGHCQAVTDQPACLLSLDLMDAYPEAKVIINQRRDVHTWYRSVMAITSIIESWPRWLRSLVDAEEFWTNRVITVGWIQYFGGNYRLNGQRVYERHYEMLREKCKKDARGYLEWKVEDGWGPLCEFLGKNVPIVDDGKGGRNIMEFPNGNAPAEFYERMGQMMKKRTRRGNIKLIAVSAIAVVVAAVVIARSI